MCVSQSRVNICAARREIVVVRHTMREPEHRGTNFVTCSSHV